MKSQINLLHKEFIPRFRWVTGSHFFFVLGLSVLFCGLLYAYFYIAYIDKNATTALMQADITKQQATIDELTNSLTQRTSDPVLQTRLSSLIEQTRVKTQLLDRIESFSSIQQKTFSNMFTSLAEADLKDIWLTEFTASSDALSIRGRLSNPQTLPGWLEKLSDTRFFNNQEFGVASLVRDGELLHFELTNTKSGNQEISSVSPDRGEE